MNASRKIAGFILGLVLVFAAAVGVGKTLGPDRDGVSADDLQTHGSETVVTHEIPGGMTSSRNSYRLELAETRIEAGRNVPVHFRIIDSTGEAVTRYVDTHEKRLHLIVVRRDLVGYQHLHPVLGSDGTWSVPVDFSRTGDYRLFLDFQHEGVVRTAEFTLSVEET